MDVVSGKHMHPSRQPPNCVIRRQSLTRRESIFGRNVSVSARAILMSYLRLDMVHQSSDGHEGLFIKNPSPASCCLFTETWMCVSVLRLHMVSKSLVSLFLKHRCAAPSRHLLLCLIPHARLTTMVVYPKPRRTSQRRRPSLNMERKRRRRKTTPSG